MRHAREGLGHRDDQCFLIVADETAQTIAQVFDRLEQTLLQGLVIGCEQRDDVEDQAKLQFSPHVQRVIALFWLEGIEREKQTVATEVSSVLFSPEVIGTAQQDEKHPEQVQHRAFRDQQVMLLRESLMKLSHRPAFPEPEVANLHNDFQCKAVAAHGQALGGLREVHPPTLDAVWVEATIPHADYLHASVQKNNILAPHRIGAFQHLVTLWALTTLRLIVAFRNITIIFGFSHPHTSLVQISGNSQLYLARGVGVNFALAAFKISNEGTCPRDTGGINGVAISFRR